MSKTKTKRARRELKRDASRKIANHQKAAVAAAKSLQKPSAPPSKKQKQKQTNDPSPTAAATAKPHVQASQRHQVPFGTYDHILLVGEGDFSFTKSLVTEHACANVTATSFDTDEQVRTKYPTFAQIYDELSALTPPVPFHHGIDATKLGSFKTLRSAEEREEGWDTIAFMFPHTGGLSTDVNRQVRANQALLVGFFNSCLCSHKSRSFLREGGKVLVCLFEGEPYTLWNVRDLARHAGLKVVESYKFEWEDYPGYAHVRTLGAIEGGWGMEGRG
ncbi:uncharacterized protein N0V89_005961 [Didymosphaeria variabile]|uniref:25S rRNA (uridine-N(3))-methyltransferase BMT5-like domain-containing protein n=1 Tax=Didymosphaeria variabile TaxID=1932322 RepID=A0A9W8XPH5_9PLEO|nr:uncharacterized protein N0V89_005961 [Didymosphaeria variabile]KAJ4354227.1 hypothetical protein N0V89_005961 [Didymosphaeria variabile]